MPPTQTTVGGGSATPVGNDWMHFLQNGLETGHYGSTANPNPVSSGPQSWSEAFLNRPSSNPARSGNPSGGMSTPGPNTGSTTSGFGDVINRILGLDPGNSVYRNPNNQAPDIFNPSTVSSDPTQLNGIISRLGQSGVNPFVNQLGSTHYDTPTYDNNTDGLSQIAQLMTMFGVNSQANPMGGITAPDSVSTGGFGSNGLLGDRSNVTKSILDYAASQNKDALASSRERFSQMGGNSNSTAAAYDEAVTNSKSATDLAHELGTQDLGYRNLDLGAYTAENNAKIGAAGVDAENFRSMLDNLTSGRTNSANLLTGASDALSRAGTLREGNNRVNLDSALGFGRLNSDNASAAGSLWNNLFGINSNNLQNAGSLTFDNMNLDSNNQQRNNENGLNRSQLDLSRYQTTGNLDQSQRGMDSNMLMGMLSQLFSSYNGASSLGIPQANTVMEQNPFLQGLQALGGAASNILPMLNFGNHSTTPSNRTSYSGTPTPQTRA